MTQRQDYETMSQQDTRFWLIKEPNFNSATFLTVLRDSLLSSRLPTYVLTMHLQCKPFLLIFRSLVILSLTLPMVSDPLPKVPPFQDIEAALETTRCKVREQIIDIRKEHPTLSPDAKLMPSCVMLRRCSGCCQSDQHRCMPTSIYTSKIEVSQLLVSSETFSYITLNFTHHAECLCQSPTDPTCIPRLCPPSHTWNKDRCRCEERCVPRECGYQQQWDPKMCRCQCRQCHPNRSVHSRFLQNQVTCLCVCRHSGRTRRRCRKRGLFSYSQCTCVDRRHH